MQGGSWKDAAGFKQSLKITISSTMKSDALFSIAAIDVCFVLILGASRCVCYCSHKASSPSAAAFSQTMLYKPCTKELAYPEPTPTLYQRGGKQRKRLVYLKNKSFSRGCCCWLACEGNVHSRCVRLEWAGRDAGSPGL